MQKLLEKTVFITGGLSGIGKACAFEAARHGANIAIADLKNSDTDIVLDELKKINPKAIYIECNVAIYAQVQVAIQKVMTTFGSLDIALNNAGIGGEANKVGDMTEESWHSVINTNLTGVFNCMKHELTQMAIQRSGCIINISSILGKVGFTNSCHYVASKHGILGLTKTAALEYAEEGIRINALCPGFIETPLLTKGGINDNAHVKKHIIDLHPMKRLGKSNEVAKAFIFLASDDSTFMTGASIDVDGGYLAE